MLVVSSATYARYFSGLLRASSRLGWFCGIDAGRCMGRPCIHVHTYAYSLNHSRRLQASDIGFAFIYGMKGYITTTYARA